MSRWHTPRCGGGDENTSVDSNGLPHCQICKSSPDVPRLLSQLVAGGTGLQIPPDEPPVQLNLSWPPTVTYSKSTPTDDTAGSAARDLGAHANSKSDAGTNAGANNDSQPVSAAVRSDTPWSPVYPKALSPEEFRLLVLDSRDTPAPGDETAHEWPVHVSLETYRDDDRPEYETVSYTWGGEDDDSSPNKPVYVGSYWDALFQTKNCYDMLRHLQPNRGIRFIWVDAICINQNDPHERAEQVAKMRTIYSNSWRVIVYLGSDIITPVPKRSLYPAKKRLEDLDTSEEGEHLLFPNLSLREVLERRYFSRIWVIQELLLSRQICIRIRDVELIVDRPFKANLGDSHRGKGRPDRNVTKAPWMAHAAQGYIADPAELLRMVALSKASDLRDNVFGIMSILHPSLSMVPDYSLSLVRARVGFAAHILLNGNAPEILLHPGPRHMGQHPSWVPWPSAGNAVWRHPTDATDDSWQTLLMSLTKSWTANLLRGSRGGMWYQPASNPGHDWRTGAHVEARTGSLSVRLVRLMPLKTMPVQISHTDGFTVVRLEAPSNGHQRRHSSGRTRSIASQRLRPHALQPKPLEFCLIFQASPHDLDLVPGEDHIFVLTPASQDAGSQCMIMRKVLGRSLAFRLIMCCHRIFLCGFSTIAALTPSISISVAGLRRDFVQFLKSTDLRRLIHGFFSEPHLGTHWCRLACLIYHAHAMSPAFPLDTIPGRRPADSAVLCALVAALNMFELDLEPRILEFRGMDCLELHLSNSKVPDQKVLGVLRSTLGLDRQAPFQFPELPRCVPQICFWRRGDTRGSRFSWTMRPPKTYTEISGSKLDQVLEILTNMITSTNEKTASAYVLLPVREDIKKYIQGNEERCVEDLARIRQDHLLDTGEVREDALTTAFKWIKAIDGEGPSSWEADTDPNMLRAIPDWPDDLVEDFGIDGSTYLVTIV